MRKIELPIAPKVVLMVASVGCALGGILPWLSYGGISSDMGPLTPIFVICGLLPLALSIVAIATKGKPFNTLSNVFGIIGGIIGLLYVVMFVVGSNMVGFDKLFSDTLSVGFWVALISTVAMIVLSIISIVKTKHRNK